MEKLPQFFAADTALNVASQLRALGQTAASDALLKTCVEVYGDDPQVMQGVARQTDNADILSGGKEAVELNRQGVRCYQQKQFEEALRLFRQAFALQPKNISIALNTAQSLLQSAGGEMSEALLEESRRCLEVWQAQLPPELQAAAELGVIDYEFARLNGMLVQLLGLYKLGVNQLPMRPGYHEVEDFLQAQLARHFEVLESRQISARCEVQSFDLMGFFDEELLGSVVANIVTNSIRYAHSALLIQAWEENGKLVLAICDDGQGYPQEMLSQQSNYVLGLKHSTGSTGLGLYFAGRIAELHERNG
ncbi:predicted protein, partial [Nematostella vectensis]